MRPPPLLLFDQFELYEMEWAPASDDMDYVGCYSDVKGERVMDDMTMQDDMTPAVCRELCVEKKSTFYGTQVRSSNYKQIPGTMIVDDWWNSFALNVHTFQLLK